MGAVSPGTIFGNAVLGVNTDDHRNVQRVAEVGNAQPRNGAVVMTHTNTINKP